MSTLRRRTNSESENRSLTFTKYSSENSKIIPLTLDMTCRDRTKEFNAVVKSKRDNGFYSSQTQNKIKNRNIHQHWSNFMEIAKQISRELSSSFEKLEKLTLLAKKRSLFDDKSFEINELTYIIKQDINSLNKQIARLQEMCKSKQNFNGKHMQSHSSVVVVSLQSKLADISSGFKDVLEVRTENLKHQKKRQNRFTNTEVSAALPVVTGQGKSVLLNDHENDGVCAINMDRPENQYQHQMQLINQQDSYIQDRADTMENIESTIVELGTIFQQLATMVKEQEEIVTRIDSNVEDAQLNVEHAHSEILKYFQSVTSNRWLMIKVFAILIVFFIIFVVFVA